MQRNKTRLLILGLTAALAGTAVGAPLGNYLENAGLRIDEASQVPFGWGTSHWGLATDGPRGFAAWRNGWGPVAEEPGAWRLDPDAGAMPSLEFCSALAWVPAGQEYTFSVELRCDRGDRAGDARLVLMGGWGGVIASLPVTATSEWQRFSLTVPVTATPVKVAVVADAGNAVQLRRPQLEVGNTPGKFAPSELDDWTPVRHTVGDTVTMVNLYGGEVKYPTRVTVTATIDALRFEFVCAAPPESATNVPERRERDSQLWHGSDSIQLFLAPEGTPFPYHQFAFDRTGNTYDSRDANPDWDGVWTVKTENNAEGWKATATIPVANFADSGRKLSPRWRWFAGRENQLQNENSGTVPLYGMFHTARRFGELDAVPVAMVRDAGLTLESHPDGFLVRNRRTEPRRLQTMVRHADGNAPWSKEAPVEVTLEPQEEAVIPAPHTTPFPAIGLVVTEGDIRIAARHENRVTGHAPECRGWDGLLLGLFVERGLAELDANRLKSIRQLGFNTVIVQLPPEPDTKEFDAMLARIRTAGLRLVPVLWFHAAADGVAAEQMVRHAAGADGIAGWIVADEPDLRDLIDAAEALQRRIKTLTPELPVWINFSPVHKFNRMSGADLAGLDHYPIPEYDWREIAPMAQTLHRDGRGTFLFLQLTGHAYFLGREPTPEEFRAMSAAALLYGGRGIGYFANLPLSYRLRAELPEILGQFVRDEAIWSAPEAVLPEHLTIPDGVIAAARQIGTRRWIIAVNLNAAEVEFAGRTLPAHAVSLEEWKDIP